MRASDRAYATLLEEIQGGQLAPGAVVGEVEQAERLGVSRTPMREAISRLVADGLVRQHSARVLVVTGFEPDDIRDLFEARRALEEASARAAARRGDAVVFAALASEFEAAQPARGAFDIGAFDTASFDTDAFDTDAYYALIARFDTELDVAANNTYLAQALRTVRTHLARARNLARDNHERLSASVREHALIAAAIAAGDAELAAHATHVHLHNALDSILRSIPTASSEGTK